MTSMTLPSTSEILDATGHLPEGATLVIPQVTWDDYERLLEELAERPHLRVSYDCGRLEIVSPLSEHENYARFIDEIVVALSDAFKLEVEPRGSTTWKKRALKKGAEPDCCYYVLNARRIIGAGNIDLESDPPPDIVVEIDTTSTSLKKFSIYAALAVPEIWRYDGKAACLYKLTNTRYVEIAESGFFHGITGPTLPEFIQMSKIQGHTQARHAFRRRIRSLGGRKVIQRKSH
jgi:Uma2 family endonuclease